MLTVPRIPLSCFIIAKNEADRLERTIGAVRELADEVIVIDSGSTDGSQAIAEKAGARVIFNSWPGFGQQKRFGETQCKHDWLLNLDADEVVTPVLAGEIAALFARGEPELAVYLLKINDVYPGQSKPRAWARDFVVPRLYDRRRVRFKDSAIHDSVDPAGHKTGLLRHEIYHFSARSFDDQMQKAVERARYNADHSKLKSVTVLKFRLVFEFPVAFLKYYFSRRHFTGGLKGFLASMIGAYSRFARIARMLEAAQQPGTVNRDPGPLNLRNQ